MFVYVFHYPAEGIPQEEPYREPRRVGREAQYVKRPVRLKVELLAGLALRKSFDYRPHVLLCIARRRFAAEQSTHGESIVLRLCSLRPADYRSIAYMLDVVLISKKVIQSRGISKGGVFAYRCVHSLLSFV